MPLLDSSTPWTLLGVGTIAASLRQWRLWRRDKGEGLGANRDLQEQRIDKLFMEIGELRAELRVVTASYADVAAQNAALRVELSLVKDERDGLRAKVDQLEGGMFSRRASDV